MSEIPVLSSANARIIPGLQFLFPETKSQMTLWKCRESLRTEAELKPLKVFN